MIMVISRVLKDKGRRAVSPRTTTSLLAPVVIVVPLPDIIYDQQQSSFRFLRICNCKHHFINCTGSNRRSSSSELSLCQHYDHTSVINYINYISSIVPAVVIVSLPETFLVEDPFNYIISSIAQVVVVIPLPENYHYL